ncbi:MAG: NAD(P)/FAD-dependent oxidoreductase [Campylobacterota bacterium]
MIYDIAIIGAGASGLMLASKLDKKKFKKICIIDGNHKVGEKIKVSGGGKCNITNEYVTSKNYLGDNNLVKDVLDSFSKDDLLTFLNKNSLHVKLNPKIVKGTYFCNFSNDVIEMFLRLTTHVQKYLNTKVLDVDFKEYFTIKTNKQNIQAKKVVVASGGLSYPKLNATSIAYDIAKKFNHDISKLDPALVGFTVQKEQFWFKNLSGISTYVNIFVEGKKVEGSLLFAHKGCSGPAILTTSLYWNKGKIAIDFLPNDNIDKYLKSNKNITTALPFAKRFTQEFLASIDLKDKQISKLTHEEKNRLMLLKYYEFAPAGNFGYSKAEVTKGGIETTQLNCFESKKQKELYFIGECLNVTGELGGFNFQFAFSSAVKCAENINNNKN